MAPSPARRPIRPGPAAAARLLALAVTLALAVAPAAQAQPRGLRPLGAEGSSARTVEPGHWAIEGGAALWQFQDPTDAAATQADRDVLAKWRLLPALPELRGLYGLPDSNEIEVFIGPTLGGGYRRPFLRADAPWGNEYLQALIELGGGLNAVAFKPMGFVRFPALFEWNAFTLHLAGGGYYLFNDQPIVDANLGAELRPFDFLHLGANAHLRMDAKHVTPLEGTWSFAGGARIQLGESFTTQIELLHDVGPPLPADSHATPRIEFPFDGLRASVTYFYP